MRRLWLLVGPLLVAATACSSDRLVFTTYTKFGLDVSAANGTTTGAMFGYKRFEGAMIPVDPSKAKGTPADIGSVLSVLDLDNGWFQGLKLFQVFATGKAAEDAAAKPDRLRTLMEAWVKEKAAEQGQADPAASKAQP